MRPMLWKEAREMGRWALLAAIVLGVFAAFVLSQTRAQLVYGSGEGNISLLSWTIAAPLVALVLGLLQILPEQRRDQWAFLVHRPATRDVLFGGKALAGLGLYGLAVSVPALIALAWAAMPGHLPIPFDARLALPGLADLLMGVPCYFAGLLTALRPARWYGSRALPVPAALAAALLAHIMSSFAQSVLVSLIFTVLFALAAWGSFRTTGQYERQPKAAKASLGVILCVGILLAVGAAVLLTAAFVPPAPEPEKPSTRIRSSYQITRAGQVLRIKVRGGRTVHAEDLQGRAVPVGKRFEDSLLVPNAGTLWDRDWTGDPTPTDYHHSASVFVLVYGSSHRTPQGMLWYYSVPERRILGYSRRTQRLALVAGPQGVVAADAPRPLPFPPGLRNNTPRNYGGGGNFTYGDGSAFTGSGLMVYDHVVYALNLAEARLAPLLTITPPERIDGMRLEYVSSPPSGPGTLPISYNPLAPVGAVFDVITQTQVRIYDPRGHLLLSVPRYLDAEQRYGDPAVYRLPKGDRYFFWYYPAPDPKRSRWQIPPSILLETDAHGKALRRETLPVIINTPYPLPPHPVYASAWGILAPPLWATGGLLYRAENPAHSHGPDWMEGLWGDLRQYPNAYRNIKWVSFVCGGGSAVLAVLIGRRCAWSRAGRAAWAFGAFWLGLYGVLLLAALDAWPAREPCPHCGRRRVVTRERCEHCGAGFVVPLPDGTEIFDAPPSAETMSI